MDFKTFSTKTAEHYTWGQGSDAWFLLKRAEISVIQERMPAGTAEVMHFHRKSRQLFYVLRGTLTMTSDSSAATIPASHVLVVEADVRHRAMNKSNESVEFLVISCPPGHGDRFDCEVTS